jgi:hypothetical protein
LDERRIGQALIKMDCADTQGFYFIFSGHVKKPPGSHREPKRGNFARYWAD